MSPKAIGQRWGCPIPTTFRYPVPQETKNDNFLALTQPQLFAPKIISLAPWNYLENFDAIVPAVSDWLYATYMIAFYYFCHVPANYMPTVMSHLREHHRH